METGNYAVQVDRTGIAGSFQTVARFETLADAIRDGWRLVRRHPRWCIEVWDDARGAVAWRPE